MFPFNGDEMNSPTKKYFELLQDLIKTKLAIHIIHVRTMKNWEASSIINRFGEMAIYWWSLK